jgi:TRAP-type C4-dicarboxylate transport system permease small subunit
MEAWLSDLPSARAFLAEGAGLLLVLAGVAHAGRRTRAVQAISRAVESGLRGLVAAVLLGMVFLSALQIVLRNLFDSGLLWIDPLLRHLVLVLALTGALLATRMKRHVQINVLGRLLRGWPRRVVGAAIAAMAGLVSLGLTHAALSLLGDEVAFGETIFLGLPSWVVVALFPVTFGAMAYRFFRLVYLELADEAPASGEDAAVSGDAGLSEEWPTLRPREREDAP